MTTALPHLPSAGPGWPGPPGPSVPPEIVPPGVPWPITPAPGPPAPGGPATVAPAWFAEDSVPAEVRSRLLDRRVVLVSGFLDDATATRAAAELMLLDGSGDDPIELHLSCPDGELAAAGALADTIDLVGVPVTALARGTVGGAALAPFAAADRRMASPLALFQLRNPSVERQGSADELLAFAERHRHEVDALHRRVAHASRRPVDEVAARFEHGEVLDADEALAAGLVHEVQRPARVTPLRPDR